MNRTASIIVFLFPAALAAAQPAPQTEEIIVNADFRSQNLADIPGSISVIGENEIEQLHADHLEEVLGMAANVNLASGASRARFYQIRGIGERGQFAEPLNPSVGLIIDNVDFSGTGNAAMLYDIEQVEVLMGPQGTRYGSNALAGLINVQSKDPLPELAYGMQLDLANFDSRSMAAYLTAPIRDNLQYRLAARHYRSDGFSRNLTLDRPSNQRDESFIRGKLSWQIQDGLELNTTLAWIDLDNGYDAFSLDNVRDTLSDQPGFDRQESRMFSSQLSSDRSDLARVEFTTAYASSDIDYGYDEDWTYLGFDPAGYSSTDYYFRQRDTLSAELRFLSRPDSRLFNDSTSWVAGLYTLHQQVELRRIYTYLSNDFTSTYEINRQAAYAESSTVLGAGWSIDIGLRAEQFEADYRDNNLLGFSPSESLFGGKLALNYRTANDALFYLSASRGYKAGGFNTDGSLDADLREFGSEKLWNYELGHKAQYFDGRLETRTALFYMSREDMQIASSTTRIRPDLSTEFIDYIGNAAAGNNYGLELSASWDASSRLNLYGNLGLLHSEYENFINSAGEDYSGREQAQAPSYQISLGGILSLNANLSLNLNLQSRDSYYFSDSHNAQSRAYSLLNASLDWQLLRNWRFSLWGRNLTDEDYFVRGFYFGNDPRDGYTAKTYTQLGEPRRIGLTLSADF